MATCKGERWSDRRKLAEGAPLVGNKKKEREALEILEALSSSSEAAEAAYLSGHVRYNSDDDELHALTRVRWLRALDLFQRADDPIGISKSALFLSHKPRPDHLFDDVLAMAKRSVAEGERSKDQRTLGRAIAALAEAYDVIGMERAARDHFVRAEELLQPWPDQMSQTFQQHGSFLLDAASTPEALEAVLALYDTAERYCEKAEREGDADKVAKVRFATPLNRADALSQLGRHDEAKHSLDEAYSRADKDPTSSAQQENLHLVAGYLAARLHKPEEAEQHFRQAALDQDEEVFDREYRWLARYELARAYRATGQLAKAEIELRTAIAIIEQQRGRSTRLELRPWILARRSAAHRELFTLLIELGRPEEALAVAESLHARAWLDAVLSSRHDADADQSAADAGAATVIQARTLLAARSSPPPAAPELMAALADREALVYVSIGSAIWRAHVRDGAVSFQQLPPVAERLIKELSVHPDAPSRAKASAILFPANLSRSREPLTIVAHGELAAFPFAALLLDGRPIIATRPVARLPGLAALRCRSSAWDDRAVFLGNSRGDLPEAEREVKAQSARHRAAAYVGAAATRQILESAGGADLLHAAVHGVTTPSGQALHLADAKLTAADVLAAGLGPRLVVLSGCATAASDAPEAWNGFPSAFLAAGSRYVIATLRSVGDAEAAQVIEAYYQQPATLSPIHRLAAAQAQLAASTRADAPSTRAWASFSAWGNAECDDDPIPAAITSPASRSGPRSTSLSLPLFGL